MDFLRQLYNGLVEAWRQLSLSARVNIALAAAAVILAIGAVVYFGAQPQYVTLVDGAEPANTQRIVEALQENGIPYRAENNNRTVMIPLKQRSAAQLLLAERDLPLGRTLLPGFELFAQTELMTTQWLQDVKFMRAMQGELQRILNAFEFVAHSHVLIREAADELFVADQRPSEAAVTLELTRPLTKREIQAIVSIISHAGGSNLHAGNITVTTTKGEVLHLPPQSEFAAIAGTKLEYVVELERQRETKLRNKLQELGVRGTVSVSARVNFDHREISAEDVTEGAELSTYMIETSIDSSEALPEGPPGVYANIPEEFAAGGMRTSEQTTEEIMNFEPSRTMTRTRSEPGDVLQYLVTLVIEGDYEDVADAEGQRVRNYVGLPETKRQLYQDLARAAVGEGETPTEVIIHDHPFDIERLAVTEMDDARMLQLQEHWARWAWIVAQLAMIAIGFLVVRRLLRSVIQEPEEIVEEEEIVELPAATREELRRQDVEREIERLSQERPDTVAALLRSWLAEDEE